MKLNYLFLTIILIELLSYNNASARIKLSENYKYAMCDFNDSTLVQQTEVTVGSWLSFYSWMLKNKSIEEARNILPDSTLVPKTVWKIFKNRQNKFNNDITQSAFSIGYFTGGCDKSICIDDTLFHGKNTTNRDGCPFYEYPITGISHEQAIQFCEWQTNVRGKGVVRYSLPSEKE